MHQRNRVVQQMINRIEEKLAEGLTLEHLARHIGYSPFYCSSLFHSVTGTTLKRYLALRRLCRAAMEIRDTSDRILDIALRWGFSSQQALTRAFVSAYGCTPAAYRHRPRPIAIRTRQEVLFPEYFECEGVTAMETLLMDATVRVEYIPAHQYIGICDSQVQHYWALWERHNCEEITGMIESMNHVAHPVLGCHTAGWRREGGCLSYTYGLGLEAGEQAEIPQGFGQWHYPGSYYLVFCHPAFDFLHHCEAVMNRVEDLAWKYDPGELNLAWNEEACQAYQIMLPETIGYEIRRPVIRLT